LAIVVAPLMSKRKAAEELTAKVPKKQKTEQQPLKAINEKTQQSIVKMVWTF
jgi:hypothetical protein